MNYKTKSTTIYILGAIIIITGVALKIMHIEYGLAVLMIGIGIGSFGSFFEIKYLKTKVKELEQQLEGNTK